MPSRISERADVFQALHREGLLLLANAWDPGSARLAVAAGARAVATSSAAVAWSLAWPDGDRLPVDVLLDTVARICDAVDLPVTIDIEGGYSDDPQDVARLVTRVLGAGAVGVNIEDGTAPPELLADKIRAARATAESQGVALYINARTDVFLRGLAPAGERVAETLRRAALYREAGASGLFVPGATAEDDLGALARGAGMPLNVMFRPGLPDAERLRTLGVRRLSAGSAIAEAVNSLALRLMRSFTATGRLEPEGAPAGYGELNALMQRPGAAQAVPVAPDPDATVLREGQASGSAGRVAAVRAVHALLDDPVVFDDPLALRILGAEREARLRADPFVLNDRMSRGLRAVLVARARVAEDELRGRIAAGVRQAVVLGAGLDTLSLRAPSLHPDLRVFEVDHPATQEAKRRRLAETGLELPAGSTFVPVDFERDDVGEGLAAAGLRGDQPVFFNWLGVSMYLTPPVVRATLAWVARSAPGSAIVFDYRVPLHTITSPVERVISTFVEQGVAQRGEPFRAAFDPEALALALRGLGYREIVDLGPAELNARLFARRKDGLSIGGTSRVLVARV